MSETLENYLSEMQNMALDVRVILSAAISLAEAGALSSSAARPDMGSLFDLVLTADRAARRLVNGLDAVNLPKGELG